MTRVCQRQRGLVSVSEFYDWVTTQTDCRYELVDGEPLAPALVMEILSPTTRLFDRYEKLEEYKTVPAFEYILLVDPDYPQVRVYRRQVAGTLNDLHAHL